MLKITIPCIEKYDENLNEFVYSKEQVLQLEHSLVSLSKWEAKWCKPFYGKDEKTSEETLDYIKCMTVTQNLKDSVYENLTVNNLREINEYIGSKQTATTFAKTFDKPSRETITAELIYYWMVTFNIPFECQKWHLNRLLTLIKVCNIKQSPPKKMNKKELLQRNKQLNAARKQQKGGV